tara:strand:+ start:300 stop:407 length:108 start_codon:yes stop_codon:yes gene_type:complete
MSELIIGIMGMIVLYCIGRVLYPDTPQQELMEEEQ